MQFRTCRILGIGALGIIGSIGAIGMVVGVSVGRPIPMELLVITMSCVSALAGVIPARITIPQEIHNVSPTSIGATVQVPIERR